MTFNFNVFDDHSAECDGCQNYFDISDLLLIGGEYLCVSCEEERDELQMFDAGSYFDSFYYDDPFPPEDVNYYD